MCVCVWFGTCNLGINYGSYSDLLSRCPVIARWKDNFALIFEVQNRLFRSVFDYTLHGFSPLSSLENRRCLHSLISLDGPLKATKTQELKAVWGHCWGKIQKLYFQLDFLHSFELGSLWMTESTYFTWKYLHFIIFTKHQDLSVKRILFS